MAWLICKAIHNVENSLKKSHFQTKNILSEPRCLTRIVSVKMSHLKRRIQNDIQNVTFEISHIQNVTFEMSHSKCLTQNATLCKSNSKCLIKNVSLKKLHSKCVSLNVSLKMSHSIPKANESKYLTQSFMLSMAEE